MQRERRAGGGEKHIVAVNGIREFQRGKTEAREKLRRAAAAVKIEVLVVVAVHVAQKNILVGHEIGVREVLFVLGRLDDEKPVGCEQARAMGERRGGRGQVFEDVVEHDHVKTAGGKRLRFNRAGEGVDAERLAGKLHDPRAHFCARGGEARPTEERDVAAVGAAEFKHARGREPAREEVTQPMRATLRQIEAGAARDVGQTVVLGLPLVPVIFRVKFAGIVLNRKRFGWERRAADERAARVAHVIIGRVRGERRMAAPTNAGASSGRRRGGAGAHA